MQASVTDVVGTALFAVAIAHTFATSIFQRLAVRQPRLAGVWHLLGEVEVVFGFWALVFVLFVAAHRGIDEATHYVDGLQYTEALFVFVIMVMAASRPILRLADGIVRRLAALLAFLPRPMALYWVTLALTPLLGSFVTEPAAMTLAALLLRDGFLRQPLSRGCKYGTLGVLLVNVSIGGTLTSYAAPPVLMVAGAWGWDSAHMVTQFGWKAAIAVGVNASAATLLFRRELVALPSAGAGTIARVPLPVTLVHVLLLAGVVAFAHHASIFIAIFLLFLGLVEAFERHHDRLLLREGLLVGFFLAGLVTLGSPQQWWLQDTLTALSPQVLYFGATALTAITDNAALTYLGSLVQGTDEAFKYALVAGAVTGGGLTVIANAPNPAGFSILGECFENESISAGRLFLAAAGPTLVAIAAFQLL